MKRILTFMLALCLVLTCSAVAAAGKITIKYARCFSIDQRSGYSIVEVKPPWLKGTAAFRYVLVPVGKPLPNNTGKARIIQVPVKRVVSLSTTQLAYLDAAGLVERLVAVSKFRYVNTPSVRRRIDSGQLKQAGDYLNLQIETMMDLEPDLILASAGGTGFDLHPKLEEAGLPVVIMSDHLEAHPLGRCEWIKFIALFFGTSRHAEKLFDQVESRYLELAAKIKQVTKKPSVLFGAPFRGQWWVPGGASFMARYISDAGGNYLWSGDTHTGSLAKDVEAVFEKAAGADIWINTGAWRWIDDALAADARLAGLKVLQKGQMYNNNRRLNRWGGNDYWESGILYPDRVLADLAAIFHPDLLPCHKLFYYKRLERKQKP